MYKLASPRKKNFWLAFVTRLLTPGHENPAVGFFWGVSRTRCRCCCWGTNIYYVYDLKKLTFLFDDVRRRIGQKPGFTVCFGSLSQPIGRGRLSREGALDVCKSREHRDKIVPNFSPPEKQEKRNFGLKFSVLLSRIACCARESTSA